jgi:hypothetical protein
VLAAVILVTTIASIFAYTYRGIRKEIEDALTKADEEEQAEIRKRVVKALFPPRFHR